MAKYIIMAEEGELTLLEKAKEELGLDLQNTEILFTGVGGINIIRSLQSLDRDAELINVGYAGSANFDLGIWVEVTEVRLNHPNVTYPEPELHLESLRDAGIPVSRDPEKKAAKHRNIIVHSIQNLIGTIVIVHVIPIIIPCNDRRRRHHQFGEL